MLINPARGIYPSKHFGSVDRIVPQKPFLPPDALVKYYGNLYLERNLMVAPGRNTLYLLPGIVDYVQPGYVMAIYSTMLPFLINIFSK